MITYPRILLADEPTGALDSKSTDELLDLFAGLHQEGQTILMVTHSVKAASRAGRVLFLKDGQVFYQLRRENDTDTQFYQRISHALTALTTGGDAQ
jgi:putative ABC transport system ATP-binding protein